jgi:hypothetical protein
VAITNETTNEICTHSPKTDHAELHQSPFDPARERGHHPAKPHPRLLTKPRNRLKSTNGVAEFLSPRAKV